MIRAPTKPLRSLPLDASRPDSSKDHTDDRAVVIDDHDVVAVVEPARAGPLVVEDGDDEVGEAEDAGEDEVGEGKDEDAAEAAEERAFAEDSGWF